MNNEELLKEFELYSAGEGRSKSTIKSYISDIEQFLSWLGDVDQFSKTTLIDYAEFLQDKTVGWDKKKKVDKKMKPTSIKRKQASIEQFIKFLNLEKNCDIKCAKKKIDVSLRAMDDFLTNKDIKRMVAVCGKEIETGATENKQNIALRDKTLILTLFYTGVRRDEVMQIKTADAKEKWISIKGKGGIYRELYIPKKLSKVLKEYAETKSGEEYMFSASGKKMNNKVVYDAVKGTARKARGIKLELAHPHALRHLYRQNLEAMGLSGTVMSQLMGHTLTVEERYGRLTKSEVYKKVSGMDLDKLIKEAAKK